MSGDRDEDRKGGGGPQRRRVRTTDDNGRTSANGDRAKGGDTYEVGFGKPPRAGQFRKGRSGNPRGRPKKPRQEPIHLADAPADTFLEREAYRLLTFRENGQEVQLPATQAVVRSSIMSALKGSRLSQRFLLELMDRKEKQYLELRLQRFVRLEKLKAQGEAQIADHQKRGLPPPDLLPHPDDIVLDHRTGEAWINGPETREDLCHYEHLADLRDLCVMQSAFNWQRRRRSSAKADAGNYCPALVFAGLADHLLPQRFRRSEADKLDLLMEFRGEDRRKLEGRIEREMARLERERPPSLLNDAQRDKTERITRAVRNQLWPEAEEG